jgi:chitin disaccharide deacetylase
VKQLVTNADDFGFTRDVNAGIIEAHREGILTATTLMAKGAAFEDAVRLARENPALDIGVHLVLVGEPGYPKTVAQLMQAVTLGRIRIYEELMAQVRGVLDAGLKPTHLDTHKHTHLFPPILNALARISEECQIRWVRRPFDIPMTASNSKNDGKTTGEIPWSKRATSRALGVVRGRFARVLGKHGCRSTDHFAGFQLTGRYDARDLARLIRALPEGSTEFMCHPGICGDELRAAGTRLKESREQELRALTSAEVREALEESGVELVTYRDLPDDSRSAD